VSTYASVNLWGTRIGAVALVDGEADASFQFDPGFLASGIEVAPLMMPLRAAPYRFPGLRAESFHGLPGLLADSLPDRFGSAVIDAWLAARGRRSSELNGVERLCYTGRRGMGALEFAPAHGPRATTAHAVEVESLVRLASRVLADRERLVVSLAGADPDEALRDILLVGTSAGGARAKAVIAFNPDTLEVRSGQVDVPPGFQHWIMKFDGVSANRDKELDDPQGYGVIEFAYAQMAGAAGIRMSECRLFEEGGRRHFMTRRFDRGDDNARLHMQSLAAMAHFDFNAAGAHSYEQALGVMRRLDLGMDAIEEQFRRMAFNVVARNQDDHVKNIAFLMDRAGRWSLSPAFDVTYAYAPAGVWTGRHQISLNGRRDDFTLADFEACGRAVSLPRGRARRLVEQVREAVVRWPHFASVAGVDDHDARRIAATHRLAL
jgi:serine/threonine-protein kinase HipA